QLHGIEIADFAVSVAKTALWIAESQAMDETQDILYQVFEFLPLKSVNNLHCGNALRMDWNDVLPAQECTYIASNPPFLGHISRSLAQTAELKEVWGREDIGRLDYVTGWYKKAIDYCSDTCEWAFVSTNSITQGEPVPVLFKAVLEAGWRIKFAHRTFVWNSEATDQAHVHCVIVGMTKKEGGAALYSYTKEGTPTLSVVPSINGYLTSGPNVYAEKRRLPLSTCLNPVTMGNMPRGKGLIVEPAEYAEVSTDPIACKYLRPFLMGKELINNTKRWCLWMEDFNQGDELESEVLHARLNSVRQDRLASSARSTREMAATPWLFGQRGFIPKGTYLGIPKVFSNNREWATCGFISPETIPGDKVYVCDDPDGFQFAIISSKIFILWQKTVGGRLKSDPSFSNTVVWNTLPVPQFSSEKRQHIIRAGKAVLDAREAHPGKSLADLYDPDRMPADLLAAHKTLDAAVEAAYGVDFGGDEEKIVAHLFKLYAELTAGE
ncbi:MAG: DNA methyltransferase, partial [Coriobacteriales bacterium]